MKIMVTGGAGFIGSNVVDAYIDAGHEVVVVDNLSTGKRENLNPAATFYEMDIRSMEIGGIMEREQIDILNHHAAQVSVPASVADPVFDADINIKGFLNLMESSLNRGVNKYIFISSGGAIYGDASDYPTSEVCRPQPLSPYALSKFVSEHYCNYYRHQYGLEYTILRYANIYGPRQVPHGEAGVVAIFMDNLLQDKVSTLFHFPDDDAGMIRDYCFVGDAVRANLKALSQGDGDFFNIGTGHGTKTRELYDCIYKTVKEIRPNLPKDLAIPLKRSTRPGDIAKSCLIVEKAHRILDWRPETALNEGIRSTLAWRTGVEMSHPKGAKKN